MVQIIHMQPKQSWQNALGSAIGEGLSEGVKINAARQARREEQAEQFKYDSLRDKQRAQLEIEKENRGKENIFNYAQSVAKRYAKPGTPQYDDMVMSIYAGGVAHPESLKQFEEMSPYQMESYSQDWKTNAMDNMRQAGQGTPDVSTQEQPSQQNPQAPQTPQEQQQSVDEQVVLPNRVATKPQTQEQGTQTPKGEQLINGKRYINGRLADPFQTNDPVEALRSINYFNNKANAKIVEKQWMDAQNVKQKAQELDINKIKSSELVKKGIREQETHEREMLKAPHEYLSKIDSTAQSAKRLEANLQSLREVIRTGNIDVFKNRFLNFMGINYEDWLSADEGVHVKLVRDMFPNVVKKFAGGGKVLEREFQEFAKTFPSLLQDIEGQKKIADFMALENQIPILENNIATQLEADYAKKGIALPVDFELKVQRLAQAQKDQIYERMHQVMSPGAPSLEDLRDSEYVVDQNGVLGTMKSSQVDAAIKSGRFKRA